MIEGNRNELGRLVLSRTGLLFAYLGCLVLSLVAASVIFYTMARIHSHVSEVRDITSSKSRSKVVMEYKRPENRSRFQNVKYRNTAVSIQPSLTSSPFQMKFTPDLQVEGGGGSIMTSGELAVMTINENETDQPLVLLYNPAIPYPERAVDLELEGILKAVLTIDTDGQVIKVEVLSSPHASITKEAHKVLKTWRFKPATSSGIPVRVKRIQTVEFKLE